MRRIIIIFLHLLIIGGFITSLCLPPTITHEYLGEIIPSSTGKIARSYTTDYNGSNPKYTYNLHIRDKYNRVRKITIYVHTSDPNYSNWIEKEILNGKAYRSDIKIGYFFLSLLLGIITGIVCIHHLVGFTSDCCGGSCSLKGICLHNDYGWGHFINDEFITVSIYKKISPIIFKFFGYEKDNN